MANGIRETFKALLLPIPVAYESDCLQAYRDSLEQIGLNPEDHAVWTQYEVREWSSSNKPSGRLKAAIDSAIRHPNEQFSSNIACNYFDLHTALQKDFLLTHTQASAFLSHLRLIYVLANDEWMSSAQIANLVGTRDSRVGISRQSISVILNKLKIGTSLNKDQVQARFIEDADLESDILADADLEAAANLVGTVAESLGCQINFGSKLLDLCPKGNLQSHPPYIQMLHYQCLIAEFYDHRLTDLYEFKPRGHIVEWLVEQYPDALTIAANPFLNNAKSVEAITLGWARSKEGKFQSALALFELLAEMEVLGFSARKELAQWTRLWIHRVMRLAKPLDNPVPNEIERNAILRFALNITADETRTSGILEQRFVDALASLIYTKVNGWVPRGVGDAVNATNTSRRKLGDVDFQNFETKHVVAFEAHAGVLTEPYFKNHMQVLDRVLEARIEEWAAYSIEGGWKIDIYFVAHHFVIPPPNDLERDGFFLRVNFITYVDLLEDAQVGNIEESIRELVIKPINEKRTPNHVRQRLLELAEA